MKVRAPRSFSSEDTAARLPVDGSVAILDRSTIQGPIAL